MSKSMFFCLKRTARKYKMMIQFHITIMLLLLHKLNVRMWVLPSKINDWQNERNQTQAAISSTIIELIQNLTTCQKSFMTLILEIDWLWILLYLEHIIFLSTVSTYSCMWATYYITYLQYHTYYFPEKNNTSVPFLLYDEGDCNWHLHSLINNLQHKHQINIHNISSIYKVHFCSRPSHCENVIKIKTGSCLFCFLMWIWQKVLGGVKSSVQFLPFYII